MLNEVTHIIKQAEELNQTHGVEMRVLTCVPLGDPKPNLEYQAS